ncbi:hypothetical protein VNO77_43018 [Canavalia gladiata]|uniref:Uncharacterized protein n=1 Tax=Canavalia gladiata TaxID=3824 RepID=A0AAN9PPN7_CANGL
MYFKIYNRIYPGYHDIHLTVESVRNTALSQSLPHDVFSLKLYGIVFGTLFNASNHLVSQIPFHVQKSHAQRAKKKEGIFSYWRNDASFSKFSGDWMVGV